MSLLTKLLALTASAVRGEFNPIDPGFPCKLIDGQYRMGMFSKNRSIHNLYKGGTIITV